MAGFPLELRAKVIRVETWTEDDEVKNLVFFGLDDIKNTFFIEVDDPEEFRAALLERLPIVITLDVPKLTPQY